MSATNTLQKKRTILLTNYCPELQHKVLCYHLLSWYGKKLVSEERESNTLKAIQCTQLLNASQYTYMSENGYVNTAYSKEVGISYTVNVLVLIDFVLKTIHVPLCLASDMHASFSIANPNKCIQKANCNILLYCQSHLHRKKTY